MTEIWMPYDTLKTLIMSNPEFWLRMLKHPKDPLKDSQAKKLPCEILGVNRREDEKWDNSLCETLCDINPCHPRSERMRRRI